MAYPTIPIEARVGATVDYKENPAKVQLREGQVREYDKKTFRQVPVTSLSYSVFVENVQEVDAFLTERKGYKPFVLPQTGLTYICTEYSISYKDTIEKGTIQMTLVTYTNNQ